jgi:hypothetical protein
VRGIYPGWRRTSGGVIGDLFLKCVYSESSRT